MIATSKIRRARLKVVGCLEATGSAGIHAEGQEQQEGIGYDLHGKITKCALAGSFDDNEAVKQTRYFEMGSTLSWCWILSECRREETGEGGKARGLWSSFLDGSKVFRQRGTPVLAPLAILSGRANSIGVQRILGGVS